MRSSLLQFVIVFVHSLTGICQDGLDSLHFRRLIDSAAIHFDIDLDKAISIYERASKLAAGTGMTREYCISEIWKHDCYLNWNQVDQAEKVISTLEKAVEIDPSAHSYEYALITISKMKVQARLGLYHEMEEALHDLLAKVPRTEEFAQAVRAALLHFARVAQLKGQYYRAAEYIERCLNFERAREQQTGTAPVLAPNEGRLGQVYVMMNLDSLAIPLLKRGAKYFREALAAYPTHSYFVPYLVSFLRDLGTAYSNLGAFEKADDLFSECLRLQGHSNSNLIRTQLAMIDNLKQQGDLEQALDLATEVKDHSADLGCQNRSRLFAIMADINLDQGNLRRARNLYADAEELLTSCEDHIALNVELVSPLLTEIKTKRLQLLASLDPVEAWKQLPAAIAAYHELQTTSVILDDQVQILEAAYRLYEIALEIDILHHVGSRQELFNFFQQSRSHLLQKSVTQNLSRGGTTADEQRREILRHKIRMLQQSLLGETDSVKVLNGKNQLFDYQEKLNWEMQDISQEYSHPSLQDVQRSLGPNKAAIAVLWGSKAVYFLQVSDQGLQVWKLPESPAVIERLVSLLMSQMIAREDFSMELDTLSDILSTATRLPESCSEVIILPDGPLASFPFNILPSLESKVVHYDNHLQLKSPGGKMTVRSISAFAPFAGTEQSVDMRGHELGNLGYSGKELSGISNVVNSQSFLREECNRAAYEDAVAHSDILHLATHARADLKNPDLSFVALYGGQEIRGFEIQSQQTEASLVTLSACETAVGKTIRGEGALSLSRAYFQAGAKAVVASLWSVNDQSTSMIMTHFYKYLKQGKRKDVALHQAQQDYLSTVDLKYRHPYYWAGFILTGSTDALRFGSNLVPFVLVLLVIFVLLVVLDANRQTA